MVLGVYQESTPSLSRALISGCVCLERSSDQAAYLGMLTVNPAAQRAGLGKQLIQAAESWIKARWASTCAIEMTVISVRSELIAFYERRGFSQTGERRPFPGYQDPERFGTPKRPDLEFVVLRKTLD